MCVYVRNYLYEPVVTTIYMYRTIDTCKHVYLQVLA